MTSLMRTLDKFNESIDNDNLDDSYNNRVSNFLNHRDHHYELWHHLNDYRLQNDILRLCRAFLTPENIITDINNLRRQIAGLERQLTIAEEPFIGRLE